MQRFLLVLAVGLAGLVSVVHDELSANEAEATTGPVRTTAGGARKVHA